jgi:hypothetical protein
MTTIILSKLNSLSCYVLTDINNRLLISESHDDLNRCTLYRGKFDQHATHFSRLVHVWPSTKRISRGPHISTFHVVVNRVEQCHCSWENGFWHNPQHVGWLIHESVPSFSPKPTIKAVGVKSNICWRHAVRLAGSINTSMRSIRSILARGGQPIGP